MPRTHWPTATDAAATWGHWTFPVVSGVQSGAVQMYVPMPMTLVHEKRAGHGDDAQLSMTCWHVAPV